MRMNRPAEWNQVTNTVTLPVSKSQVRKMVKAIQAGKKIEWQFTASIVETK